MDENYYSSPPPSNPDDDNYIGAWIFGILALVAVVVVAATWWASPTDIKQVGTEEKIRLDDRIGQSLSLNGTVDDFISSQAFTMKGDSTFSDEVLVISKTALPTERPQNVAVDEKELVQVTGKVHKFNRADMERELGMTLDPSKFDSYNDKLVIIADSVNLPNQPIDTSIKPEEIKDSSAAPTLSEPAPAEEPPAAPAQPAEEKKDEAAAKTEAPPAEEAPQGEQPPQEKPTETEAQPESAPQTND